MDGRHGELILRVGDGFYWPLPLSRGGRCREYGTSAGTKNRGR